LSATIDEIEEFEYYKKDIREMIDNGYLCDYSIHIPIFSDDPTSTNVCQHLLNNYRSIIVYCDTKREGRSINEIFNKLRKNSSAYIDCDTSKKQRYDIIQKYKKGNLPFLVNVRVLVEGFNAPITNGVCFMHLPSSRTTLIQIIGRALRLHPDKIFANIILPFSSNEDEHNIGTV
jgi:superfamily II DNA or RNA helicase